MISDKARKDRTTGYDRSANARFQYLVSLKTLT